MGLDRHSAAEGGLPSGLDPGFESSPLSRVHRPYSGWLPHAWPNIFIRASVRTLSFPVMSQSTAAMAFEPSAASTLWRFGRLYLASPDRALVLSVDEKSLEDRANLLLVSALRINRAGTDSV